jgi:hypothetical protein
VRRRVGDPAAGKTTQQRRSLGQVATGHRLEIKR